MENCSCVYDRESDCLSQGVFGLSLSLWVIISARSHSLGVRCQLSTCWLWLGSCEEGKCDPGCWVKGMEPPWFLPLGSVHRCWGICRDDGAVCLPGGHRCAVHEVGYEVQRSGEQHGGRLAPAGRGWAHGTSAGGLGRHGWVSRWGHDRNLSCCPLWKEWEEFEWVKCWLH